MCISKNLNRRNDYSNLTSMIHVNIRSVPSNLSTFEYFLESLELEFNIIGFSETWFNEDNHDLYGISKYTCVNNYRIAKSGGGVSLFLKNHIKFVPRPDLTILSDSFESVFVELTNVSMTKNMSSVLIGVVYRPPASSKDVFLEHMNNVLFTIDRERKQSFIMGDFNYNLLEESTNTAIGEFNDLMYTYSHLPLISRPTRFDEHTGSATLIDNIFTNVHMETRLSHGINCVKIADHFPVFCIFNSNSKGPPRPLTPRRNLSNHNIDRFLRILMVENWDCVVASRNAQTSFQLFYHKFKLLYDACFPISDPKSEYRERKPWLSSGLKKSIKRKNKLYLKFLRRPSVNNKVKYTRFRNILKSLLKKAEKIHYSSLMNEHKSNMKKSWKIIKEVLNKGKPPLENEQFCINGQLDGDRNTIAGAFNTYFVNVGPKLAEEIPPSPVDPTSYVPHNRHTFLWSQLMRRKLSQ